MEILTKVFSSLPITDHTFVFLIVLAVILLAPMLFSKLHIPHLIGMILAGVLLGEHGLGVLRRDESFELFGNVGIYYIMFLAGLEMDMQGLKQNRAHGLVFGLLTCLLPALLGYISGIAVLRESRGASCLLACIFASHTLVSYPIVGRYQLSRHRSVMVSVAATMVALLLALLALAVLSNGYTGAGGGLFWLLFVAKFACYLLLLFLVYPRVIRWFFRTWNDPVLQFIFVLTLMFLAAAGAEVCGVEGLLGAFLSGLVFNRFIPSSAPLMNRVEFVGNALFIPYFLIGVGMLVNLRPLLTDGRAQLVAATMVVVGTAAKFLASFLMRHVMHLNAHSGLMMFGLTEAHAAGALAMVMVGTELATADGHPLMSSTMLDGVVVMILLSCIISSVATDQASRLLKIDQEHDLQLGIKHEEQSAHDDEKILIPVNDTDNISQLVLAANMMRNKALNRGLICLNVVNDDDRTGLLEQHSRECLRLAEQECAAVDAKVQTQSRLAVNFVNGTIHAFRENDASEILIGLHRPRHAGDSLLGRYGQGLVDGQLRQIMILDTKIPINTIRRIVVVVPEQAQYEPGFLRWAERLARLAVEVGCRIQFHAAEQTATLLREYNSRMHPLLRDEYILFASASLESLSGTVGEGDLLVPVMARRGTISFEKSMNHLQRDLRQHFPQASLLIVYPDQEGDVRSDFSFSDPHGSEIHSPSRLSQWLSRWIRKIG